MNPDYKQPPAGPMKWPTHHTRSEVIFGYTRRMLHETRTSMGSFALGVVEHYQDAVPAEARVVEFKTDGDPFRCQVTNAQKLTRYMDPDTNARLPDDLEESWVLSLMQPYRSACVRDLAHRYGLLDVQVPEEQGGESDVQVISKLTAELGGTLTSLSPLLTDGRITPEDAPLIPDALSHIEQLIAAAETIHGRLKQAISASKGE